jgi:hypothetical protein
MNPGTIRLSVMIALAFVAGTAAAQDPAAAADSRSLGPLLIMTGIVLLAVIGMLWLVSKFSRKRRVPKAPSPDEAPEKLSSREQAVGAFAAFEKAKLMGKKVAAARDEQLAKGGEAGDEHPS